MEHGNKLPSEEGTENLLEKIEHHLPDYEDVRTGKRFPLWLRRLTNFLLIVLIVPVLVFQIPWVQSKVAQKLTAYLSKELQTTVSIERVSLGVFNQLSLDKFYLEDLSGDTLIYAGRLKVNHSGLYMLLFRKFDIESLTLSNAGVRIAKTAGQQSNNFQFLIDYFSDGKKETKEPPPARPFNLNLRHLYLHNVHFQKPDDVKGENMDLKIRKAEGHFHRFDLQKKRIEFSSLTLDSPDFILKILPEQPLPDTKPPVQLTAERLAAPDSDSSQLLVKIRDFNLRSGRFSLQNIRNEPVRTTPLDILNFNYMDVFDIEININDFSFYDLDFKGEVEKIAFRDSSGFVLDKLAAKEATLTCKGMELYGMELVTPYTRLGDTLIFRYNSYHAFENFENDVKMEGRFHNASVALRDIMVFAPALNSNAFFKENEEEIFKIDGLVRGPVNRLDGRDLKINLAGGVHIDGDFSTRNLAVPEEQFLHLNLNRLLTDVKTLRKLIPDFRPPDNFDRLGKFDFKGKFDGFFVDFVADGHLKTDIGIATMFMNLKLRDGREKARYSGDLYLKDFDLGAWSGNEDFGKVTFNSHVKEGYGLTLNAARASLQANIDSLTFRGYQYTNAAINGQLKKNLFIGDLNIQDENIHFNFLGEVNLTDTVPSFNFKADVQHLSLLPLHLSEKDFQFSGKADINMKGKRLSGMAGEAQLEDFIIVKNGKDSLFIDSIEIASKALPNGEKHFVVNSNLGHMDVKGRFDIEKTPAKFQEFIVDNYPRYAERLGIEVKNRTQDTARFEFAIELFELQNIFHFFEEKLEGFDQSKINGTYDGYRKELSVQVEVPLWSFQNIEFRDVYFKTKLESEEGSLQLGVIETQLSENQKLSPVSLIGDIYKDTLEFLIISSNFFTILDNININGSLTLDHEDAWRVSFKPSDLVILNQTWEINTANYLRFGKGSVETNNFSLSHADQQIILRSLRNEGLEFQLKNYPLDSLEFIKNIPNHRISGIGDIYLKVKDLFNFQGLSTLLRVDKLTINGDNYGTLRLDASAPSVKETVSGYFSIMNDSMELAVDGYFNPPGFEEKGDADRWITKQANYFDVDVSFSNYPIKIIRYFVADISNVRGTASAKRIRMYGEFNKPELTGEVEVNNTGFTINALRTDYRIPTAIVKVSSRLIDGTGNWVYDRFGNKAFVEGGITHNNLKDFGLDLRISTETGRGFLGLETTAKDNSIFYGTAIGTGYARFSGNFKQPNLYVNGRSLAGTNIVIPVSSTAPTKEVRFISFSDSNGQKDNSGNKPLPTDLRGLNMEFDLDLTTGAQMEMIFDKAWGDVLRGTGNGTIKIIITREGQFDMYGNYVVASGDYLFTMMNLVLNKSFAVEPGGTVTWSGDPYNATINVNAVYKGLTTSVYNFIQEYTTTFSEDQKRLARTGTPVDLKMRLKGSLMRPDIDFDFDFPSLDSELRNYAENKIRTIRQDPNELNRQVFGLLVLGQFLPSGYTLQAGDVGINTLSEMLSNQLSIYLTEFVSELFTGSDFIKGIDLDISYNRYTGGALNDPTIIPGNELQGRLKVMVTDRVAIHVGGNFDIGGSNQVYSTNSSLLAGEFMIEYVISRDGRLKIKAYNSTEPDIAGGRRNKIGAGISFRKEFDSLADLLNFKKKN